MNSARRNTRSGSSIRRSTNITSSQQPSQQPAQARDLFPLYSIKEITDCLLFCGFEVSEELIKKPTAAFIFQLYEQFLEQCISIPHGRVEKLTRKLLQEQQRTTNMEENGNNEDRAKILSEVEEMEMVTNRYMVLNKFCQKFFSNIGFYDFGLFDIAKPDPMRTHRILSAFLNYLRFREEVSPKFEEMSQELEEKLKELEITKQEYEIPLKVKQDLQLKYGKTIEERREKLLTVTNLATDLDSKIQKLRHVVVELNEEANEYKQEKSQRTQRLEDVRNLLKDELAKIRALTIIKSTDVKTLQDSMTSAQTKTKEREQAIQQLKQVLENYTTTLRSIKLVQQELQELLEMGQEMNDIEEHIDQLQLQIRRIKNEIEKLKKLNQDRQDEVNNSQNKYNATKEKLAKLIIDSEATNKQDQANLKQQQMKHYEGMIEVNKILEESQQLKIECDRIHQETEKIITEFEIEKQKAKTKFDEVQRQLGKYIQGVDPILKI